MKKLALALSAALLTACGGGGGEGGDSPQSISPCPPVVVQLFGDSTQQGFDGATRSIAPNNPSASLQRALDARFGVGRTKVLDQAVAGSSSLELLNGTDGKNLPWPRSVIGDVIVINHGINDMTSLRGIDAYEANLEALVSKTPEGVDLVFETPNKVRNWTISGYAQRMRDVAKKHDVPVADTYAYTDKLANWEDLMPDWAHPSDKLYEMISRDVLVPAVVPLVQARVICGA